MPDYVDIRKVNTDNYNGVVEFLWEMGYPKGDQSGGQSKLIRTWR
jgi:hypothetical protein